MAGIKKRDGQSLCVLIYMCVYGLRMMECINTAQCKSVFFVVSKLVPHYFPIRINLSYVLAALSFWMRKWLLLGDCTTPLTCEGENVTVVCGYRSLQRPTDKMFGA